MSERLRAGERTRRSHCGQHAGGSGQASASGSRARTRTRAHAPGEQLPRVGRTPHCANTKVPFNTSIHRIRHCSLAKTRTHQIMPALLKSHDSLTAAKSQEHLKSPVRYLEMHPTQPAFRSFPHTNLQKIANKDERKPTPSARKQEPQPPPNSRSSTETKEIVTSNGGKWRSRGVLRVLGSQSSTRLPHRSPLALPLLRSYQSPSNSLSLPLSLSSREEGKWSGGQEKKRKA